MAALVLLAVGERLPAWATLAVADYQQRLTRDYPLTLREIPAARRSQRRTGDHEGHAAHYGQDEGARLLALLPPQAWVVALHGTGSSWSSRQLATELAQWRQRGLPVYLLIGGPDGLAPDVLARANQQWSLSALTFPHALARVIVVEQLYRAASLLQGHPYHRE